jgi:hypothetical protein
MERALKEDLLTLCRRDPVAFPVLIDVPGIPFEAGTRGEFRGKLVHGISI